MRVLVSGGAGFIGSHVTDALLAAGHRVTVVDDLSTGRAENVHPDAEFHRVDIQDAAMEGVFRSAMPEVLCHHAAQMDVRRSVSDPVFDARVNVLGLLNLLELGRRHGLRRVVFASSGGAIYGEQGVIPTPEEQKTEPVCPYGVTKLAGERYLHFYAVEYGIPYVALRYANVFGPRQNPHGEAGVVAIFIEKFLRGELPVINGDGRQTRDYVYVADVVRANLAALASTATGAFNVGTGVETDVVALFAHLRELCGCTVPAIHGPGKPGEQRRSAVDGRRAAELLGWSPTVALEDGLRQTVEYYRARLQARP